MRDCKYLGIVLVIGVALVAAAIFVLSGCSALQSAAAPVIGAPSPAVVQAAATQAAADQAAVATTNQEAQTLAAAATQPGAGANQAAIAGQLVQLQGQASQEAVALTAAMASLSKLISQTNAAVSAAQGTIQAVGAASALVPGGAVLGVPIAGIVTGLLGLLFGGGGAYAYANQVAGNQTATQQVQTNQAIISNIAQTVASLIPAMQPAHAVALTAALGGNAVASATGAPVGGLKPA